MKKLPAEKVNIWYPDSLGGYMDRLDHPFDETTGKKNYADVYECPNKSQYFVDSHDKIVSYKGEKHYV